MWGIIGFLLGCVVGYALYSHRNKTLNIELTRVEKINKGLIESLERCRNKNRKKNEHGDIG